MFEPAAGPPPRRTPAIRQAAFATPRRDLEFFNGLGGFAADGREYVTILGEGQWTPAPWINVIANPSFGFQVSVEGAGYTWAINSQQHQITQWSNDPVTDRPGEALYVRDLETGELWGPTALPIREDGAPYVVRHGQGYSIFEHTSHGISLELTQFVPLDDSVKVSRLKIRNLSPRADACRSLLTSSGCSERRAAPPHHTSSPRSSLKLTRYWRAILSASSTAAGSHSPTCAAIQLSWTADRTEFIGRNSTLDNPAALAAGRPLSAKSGAAMDPCAALQTTVLLRPNTVSEVVFFLGEAASRPEAIASIKKYRAADLDAVLAAVTRYWDGLLGTVQVKTSGPLDGPHAQPMAAVSDPCVPLVGALRVLPGGRRVRLSRSASGRDGVDGRTACADARASASGSVAAVRRRRRATLVAAARGAGSSHAYRRRSRVARRTRSLIISR